MAACDADRACWLLKRGCLKRSVCGLPFQPETAAKGRKLAVGAHWLHLG
jgi:hypothetical protein